MLKFVRWVLCSLSTLAWASHGGAQSTPDGLTSVAAGYSDWQSSVGTSGERMHLETALEPLVAMSEAVVARTVVGFCARRPAGLVECEKERGSDSSEVNPPTLSTRETAPNGDPCTRGVIRYTAPGCRFRERLRSGGEGPEMIVVSAGSFLMGCAPEREPCSHWQQRSREVTIPHAFAVSVYEVTFEDFDRFAYPEVVDDEGWGRGRRPVINVSWEAAKDYVEWLSRETYKTYRLLSEAEWEYAARGGSAMVYSWGNQIGRGRANCRNEGHLEPTGCGDQWDTTAPVGSFDANALGLFDMHGNVFEWVEDCFGDLKGELTDGSPLVFPSCTLRVFRSGSWDSDPRDLSASYRSYEVPIDGGRRLGFRVARTVDVIRARPVSTAEGSRRLDH